MWYRRCVGSGECDMEYATLLLSYAEVALKGKNRNFFEEALVKRIEAVLADCTGTFRIVRYAGRIYVEAADYDFDETIDALQHVFGIVGIAPAVTMRRIEKTDHVPSALPDTDAIGEEVLRFVEETYIRSGRATPSRPLTFKVKCRRVDKKYPLTCMEVDAILGEKILDAYEDCLKVDVHEPDFLLRVELRENVHIYSDVIKGPGGMPIGSNGKAMLLLSGGIDSPVAGYMVAKRGVTMEAVYFHAPPYTSERAKQKVVDLAQVIASYTGGVKLHVINFTDIQMYIYEKCPKDELTIIMRRYMMRIAEKLALDAGCLALVTGESIGQVASQTMQSLLSTNEVVTGMPVFRPLIAMDKQEIVSIADRIGTYETSILPYEDCCTIFVAKHPVTKPRTDVIRKHELLLGTEIDALLERAYESAEVIEVR